MVSEKTQTPTTATLAVFVRTLEDFFFARTKNRKEVSLVLMQEVAKKRGGKLLSPEYFDEKTKLLWECSKGHQWEAIPSNVYHYNHWCPECAREKWTKIDWTGRMRDFAAKNGGELMSPCYINSSTKLIWKCDKGHIWETLPMNVRRGHWCPICSKGKAGRKRTAHQ
jgi:hypothetical protein